MHIGMCIAHWVIILHRGLEGCSQPRKLWFIDIQCVLECSDILVFELDDEGRGVRLGGEGRRELRVDVVVREGGEGGRGG